jgi:hypothetical protein
MEIFSMEIIRMSGNRDSEVPCLRSTRLRSSRILRSLTRARRTDRHSCSADSSSITLVTTMGWGWVEGRVPKWCICGGDAGVTAGRWVVQAPASPGDRPPRGARRIRARRTDARPWRHPRATLVERAALPVNRRLRSRKIRDRSVPMVPLRTPTWPGSQKAGAPCPARLSGTRRCRANRHPRPGVN